MKVRWKGKTWIFGRKAKAEYRAKVRNQLSQISRLVTSRSNNKAEIDWAEEFAELRTLGTGKDSPFMNMEMSARERIITITSYLAEYLRWILTVKVAGTKGKAPSSAEMREIFENYGPLASFADRISVCSGLGLIPDDIKSDLRILKGIRNDYAAHSFKPISFNDPEIVAACSKLKLGKSPSTIFESEAETRFVASSLTMLIALAHLGHLLSEQSRVLSENADEIIRRSAIRFNEGLKAAGVTFQIDVPPEPSPDKSSPT